MYGGAERSNLERKQEKSKKTSIIMCAASNTDENRFGCFEGKLKSDGNARNPCLTKIY